MENPENLPIIIPPHLNAEIYRSDTTNNNSQYLDFLQLHADGSVLVGCSELTGRRWDGSASVFRSVAEARELHNEAKKTIELSTGTPDGLFVQHTSKVLLCEDSGAVSVWSVSEDVWKVWSQDAYVTEHDDAALAVDCLDPGTAYVTVGADGNAKVWDVTEMICMRSYDGAHNRAIYGVATRPGTTTSFATGSLDHYVSLWDDLVTKPVLDLSENNHGVRCVQWLDENRLLFGDEAGMLSIVDIRNTDPVQKLATFPAALHKIVVQPEKNKIAVCCDNKTLSVCEIGDNNVATTIYKDQLSHKNYIRGLAWDIEENNTLHSVGWDGEIKTHVI